MKNVQLIPIITLIIGLSACNQQTDMTDLITINVETNDEKATYEIKNNKNLSIGENNIIIEVKEGEYLNNIISNLD